MEYDCEMIYTADNFCLVRVGSFIVLLSKFGFATTGNRADWNERLGDLKAADADIQEIWAKLGLPNTPDDSPGHDKLVVAAAECARANRVGWWA